jgi:hypothetical protein
MENQATVTEEKKNYPFDTTDGYQYLDETDEVMLIETKRYENGSIVKRITLSDKRIAEVRELKGWEMEESAKFHENKANQVTMGVAALCTKIDGKNVVFEDLKFMKGKDWNKIKYAAAELNF